MTNKTRAHQVVNSPSRPTSLIGDDSDARPVCLRNERMLLSYRLLSDGRDV